MNERNQIINLLLARCDELNQTVQQYQVDLAAANKKIEELTPKTSETNS